MKKTNLYKFLFIVIISVMFILSILNLVKLFAPTQGILVSKTELNKIKSSIDSYSNDYKSLKVTSIEGNKRYVLITFVSTNYSNGYKTLNVLYDTKKNNIIKSVDFNDNTINLLDAGFVKYVRDNTFLVLDSFGNLYNLNADSNKIKTKLVLETGISKDNLFKYFYKDKSIYMISRDTLSKYNEKTLSNNKILEVKFKNNNFKKADTVTYNFNESDFIYSFVLDSEGNVGVVGSGVKDVLGETANSLLLPSDEEYLSNVPSSNKNYKFIDTSSVWVRFLNDDSIVNIKEEDLNLEYRAIHSLVNKKLDINISSPSNIPILISDGFTLFSEFKYEDLLYNTPFFPVCNAVKVYGDSETEKESISSIRSNIYWLNYKTNKYIAFFPSKDGIVGIKKNGTIDNVLNFTIGFAYKNLSIFLEDNTIKFKKL